MTDIFVLVVYRLLHLAIIHEAKDYIKQMIELSKNTDFLDAQNDQRQVCRSLLTVVLSLLFTLCLIPEISTVLLMSQTNLVSPVCTNV